MLTAVDIICLDDSPSMSELHMPSPVNPDWFMVCRPCTVYFICPANQLCVAPVLACLWRSSLVSLFTCNACLVLYSLSLSCRSAFATLYSGQASQMAERLGRIREKECSKREQFKKSVERFIPQQVAPATSLLVHMCC